MKLHDKLTSAIYRRIIAEFVTPCLVRAGFKRASKDRFFLREGDALWRVVCGLRPEPGRDEGWLDVTVCIGFCSLAEFLCACPLVRIRDPEKPCAMATNLGHLMPIRNFYEWRLLPDTNEITIGREIVEAINTYGLHYFEKYGTLDKALAAWEKGVNYNLGSRVDYYVAAVYWLRGDRGRAIEFIHHRITHYSDLHRSYNRPLDLTLCREREQFSRFLETMDTSVGSSKSVRSNKPKVSNDKNESY
jgi:hypothetical protein